MNNEKYRYLFPYEKVKPNSKILIYGAGIVGMEYLTQMMITHYCQVIGLIDRNYREYDSFAVPVYSPDHISRLAIDYVVIAVSTGKNVSDMKGILLAQGITEEKIVCTITRETTDLSIASAELWDEAKVPAFERTDLSAAFLLAGGIGDMVINKRFIEEVIRFVPDIIIDIYYANSGDFLSYLYSDCKNVNIILPNLGMRYGAQCHKYSIALDIMSHRYVHVNVFREELYAKYNQEFARRICRLKEESDKEDFSANTLPYIIFKTRLYNGYNAYTAFGYNGAFEITDKEVHLPLIPESKMKFFQLGLDKYITINYGNGAHEKGGGISKAWPLEYYEQTIILLKEKYPHIKLVQVGGEKVEKIKGADIYLRGEHFGTAAYILKNAIFHLDIEGGLVHIATQLGTKCIVLFGPTPKEYFGYDNNINISAGTCHNCYGLYRDQNKCARSMSRPECMYSITPELVMKYIDSYMDQISR